MLRIFKQKNIVLKLDWKIFIISVSIGLLIGVITSYSFFNQKLISQNTKQNANIESLSKQIVACQHDPSSNECNPQWNLNNTGYIPGLSSKDQIGINCQNTATDAASIYWRYKNCPSPTPLIKYVNITSTPSPFPGTQIPAGGIDFGGGLPQLK